METTRWVLHCPQCDKPLRMELDDAGQAEVIAGMRSGDLTLTHPAEDGTEHALVLHPSLTLN